MLDATGLCCDATFYVHIRDIYVAMHLIFMLTKLTNDNMQLNQVDMQNKYVNMQLCDTDERDQYVHLQLV